MKKFAIVVGGVVGLIILLGEQIMIPGFSAAVGESSFSGSIRAAQIFTQPDVTFTLDASTLNVDEFLGVISQAFTPSSPSAFRFAASTRDSPTSQTSQTASPLEVWQISRINATGKIAIAHGQAKGVRFSCSHWWNTLKTGNQYQKC